jgi:membrane-bound lytic murein transglycosylase A
MNTKINSAPSASSNNNVMSATVLMSQRHTMWAALLIVGTLAGCAAPRWVMTPQSPPPAAPSQAAVVVAPEAPNYGDFKDLPIDAAVLPWFAWDDRQALPSPKRQASSVWQPVRWRDVPAWGSDNLESAWGALLRSCEAAPAPLKPYCAATRQLSIGSAEQRLAWLMQQWQPYQVVAADGNPKGLLTGYFEPMLRASRLRTESHQTPLYAKPDGLRNGQTWYTREEMEVNPSALEALRDKAIAWVQDPIDALIVQIQGSGRVEITEPDGRVQVARLAFAAHNGHTYASVARVLLDTKAITSPSWPAIKAWAAANPSDVQRVLWTNPRTVFFQEEDLNGMDAQAGPRGAQSVPLTPMRSIAVDRSSIAYGTPVWMVTRGPTFNSARLVVAQDTGGAIIGAVRADFFTGWGPDAAQLAGGLKQPLGLWVLWPRDLP